MYSNEMAMIYPPGVDEPHSRPPVPNDLRNVQNDFTCHTTREELLDADRYDPNFKPPPYLPQAEDYFPAKLDKAMLPAGSWATGHLNHRNFDGLTGTRPVVDKYSVTRFGLGDWRKRNAELLKRSDLERAKAEINEWNARSTVDSVLSLARGDQSDSTLRLKGRQSEVHRWKLELRASIVRMTEEIDFLEVDRRRLKQALKVVLLPASIAGECIERRTSRPDVELVRDQVEDELVNELALTSEIDQFLKQTLKNVENQMVENVNAKKSLEYEWADKWTCHEIESKAARLNNKSQTAVFKEGVSTYYANQSTKELWDEHVRKILTNGEETRERSSRLRDALSEILMNASRDLKIQADKVDAVLAERVATVEEVYRELGLELRRVLKKIVDLEDLFPKLRDHIRRLDIPLKVAQTRLDYRYYRPRVENVRDLAQIGLMEEIKTINTSSTEIRARLKEARDTHEELLLTRSDLEREVSAKRRVLEIDSFVLRAIRSQYPTVHALTGYTD